MLTYENVSFSSVKKTLTGIKTQDICSLCYPKDLLPHKRQSIDKSEIILFCFFVG